MRLPVDTSAVSFVSAGPPEPSIDFDTKVQRTDDEGRPVFQVFLFAIGAGGRDVIGVKVAGEPKGVGEFTPVKLTGLVATTWAMGDRAGVSFRADKLEAATPARPAA